jgi:hypothetical protein
MSLDSSNNILYTLSLSFIHKFDMNTYTFVFRTDILVGGDNPTSLVYSSFYPAVYVGYTSTNLNLYSI